MDPSPYAPPREVRDARPRVIFWFRIYAAAMTALSLAVLSLAVASALSASGAITGAPGDASPYYVALLTLGASLVLAVLFAVATFVPYRPWGWSIGLLAIAMGLVSVSVFFAVPLLVLWVRPNVKAAFARL